MRTTNPGATCTVSRGTGSYADGTNIQVVVEKACSLPIVQQVSYSVTGHF